MLESFEIARLGPNADVGYYSCESYNTEYLVITLCFGMFLSCLYGHFATCMIMTHMLVQGFASFLSQ